MSEVVVVGPKIAADAQTCLRHLLEAEKGWTWEDTVGTRSCTQHTSGASPRRPGSSASCGSSAALRNWFRKDLETWILFFAADVQEAFDCSHLLSCFILCLAANLLGLCFSEAEDIEAAAPAETPLQPC